MLDEHVGRIFSCARCHEMVVVCHRCDWGRMYCSPQCRELARRKRVSERRPWATPHAKRLASRRNQAYRERGKLSAKIETLPPLTEAVFRSSITNEVTRANHGSDLEAKEGLTDDAENEHCEYNPEHTFVMEGRLEEASSTSTKCAKAERGRAMDVPAVHGAGHRGTTPGRFQRCMVCSAVVLLVRPGDVWIRPAMRRHSETRSTRSPRQPRAPAARF